ncbi:MAG: hypothetical protein IT233_03115 [Bacteroidia bacterium]|nr:hypothetical protein [Bacteroidia bacterium]
MRTLSLSMLLVLLISFPACKKYEDGPLFSLRSKKERIANDWKISGYWENGVNKLTDFQNTFQGAKYSLTKSENFVFTYKLLGLIDVEQSGTWHLSGDKDAILFNQTAPTADNWSLTILRLKERELWLQETDSGTVKEYHFLPF